MDIGRADEFTVGAWAKTWYELYSKPNVRESTQERYWNHIRFHIIPYVGRIKLAKLTGRDIQKMYNDVRDHGRIRKGPNDKRDSSLSASYITVTISCATTVEPGATDMSDNFHI